MNSDSINSTNISNMNLDNLSISRSHTKFVLGWAFQENLKVNQKESVKRLTEQVKKLLRGEIQQHDIPKVSTIAN
ncbi:9663_t:CDS:2 [Scutellospora calospora]|uniref:9663_t:CDS:1 n=1 Tax=Scutellospora calospora TaxID=85575 RepID=A0ACA9K4T4_9GLOM|nr:9663_t:CDS:2 [Scutellospora calospora]